MLTLSEHGIKIARPDLPVINVGSEAKPSYLPAELCHVRPGQPYHTKLNEPQTQNMIKFAVRKPEENIASILNSGIRLLGFDPPNHPMVRNVLYQYLHGILLTFAQEAFGIGAPSKLITVSGWTLPAPKIQYGNDSRNPAAGKWNMQAMRFSAPVTLTHWTYLRILFQGTRQHWKNNAAFTGKIKEFRAQLANLGLNPGVPVDGPQITVNHGNVRAEIRRMIQAIKSRYPLTQAVLVIVPEVAKTMVFNYVKYICDIEEGIINVCVLDSKFAKATAQYLANVGLKFNLKLGGRNHDLNPSRLGVIRDKTTMVVGIDVTHPSPGAPLDAHSVAGIVASVDERLGQWPATIRIQTGRQEMVDDLKEMFKSRLLLWKSKNSKLPDNILVYRDGVSEGQYDTVLNHELPRLQAACATLYPATQSRLASKPGDPLPRITIVIVGKRYNTRFYKANEDKDRNPKHGTVVDRGVTEARKWDFFLQAHTALQGTARPAHYHVIYDEIFRAQKHAAGFSSNADALEDLTHNMCYLFGRATTAVSICPPVYYADLVCTRARCYLSEMPNPQKVAEDEKGKSGDGAKPEMPPKGPREKIKIHENIMNKMFFI